MQNLPRLETFDKESEQSLRLFEERLGEHAAFLATLCPRLVERWTELYLSVFGRSAFFSTQRVQKIFKELAELLVQCLKEKRLDIYFENLKEKGALFYRLGVPFEEVIISLHLFEETCLEQFLNAYPRRSLLPEFLCAMEELHHEGLTYLAASYFETTKKEMQKVTNSLLEENEALQNDLAQTKDSFFIHTRKELASMQLMISGVNHKLRNRVYQLSRIQKMSDTLENELQVPKLLKTASTQFLAICPPNSDVYFGFFDEERRKVNLYNQPLRQSPECDIVKTFYFSELPAAFQEALYDESKRVAHFKGTQDVPKVLTELVALRNHKEFLVVPIRRYREAIGFIFLSTQVDNFFSKNNYKFCQRLGQVVSKAVIAAALFTKSKKQEEFALLLTELNHGPRERKPFETTLDFCLGSLIDLLGAERSSLMRFDDEKKELKVFAAKGYRVYPITGMPIKWGEGIAGLALKESKVISITKMREPDRTNLFARLLGREENRELCVKSLLCMPLFQLEKPIGVINISTINFHKDFERSDIDMAHEVANRIAGILQDLPAKD